jgi:hypothetical protein
LEAHVLSTISPYKTLWYLLIVPAIHHWYNAQEINNRTHLQENVDALNVLQMVPFSHNVFSPLFKTPFHVIVCLEPLQPAPKHLQEKIKKFSVAMLGIAPAHLVPLDHVQYIARAPVMRARMV